MPEITEVDEGFWKLVAVNTKRLVLAETVPKVTVSVVEVMTQEAIANPEEGSVGVHTPELKDAVLEGIVNTTT